MFAIDVTKGMLQGSAELDVQKNFISMPIFCGIDISGYLRNAAGNFLYSDKFTVFFVCDYV